MAVSGGEPVWRRLGAALEQAGSLPGAAGSYPRLVSAHPIFYAAEQVGAGWLILGESSATPQEARDELAHQFLLRAAHAEAVSRE